MVLKLYGYNLSTCTQRVATVLIEKKVPFELVNIDMSKGEHKAEAFVKMQPFGQVPVLEDDGFTLYESRAICRYIAIKYANQGTQLYPEDLKKRALIEQAASVEGSNWDPYASGIAAEKIFKKRRGLETDEALVVKHIAGLGGRLDVYEKILSKQKYIAGDEFSLADVFHLPYGVKLYQAGYDDLIESRPNVKRWFNELRNRDSWKAVEGGVKSTPSY
ncbi:glutathione S-transferase [Amanita rubescens]|nr:glutathione S-transferase [Amanita rubescens]